MGLCVCPTRRVRPEARAAAAAAGIRYQLPVPVTLDTSLSGLRAGGGQSALGVSFPYWRGTWEREGVKEGVFAHSRFALELARRLPKDARSCTLLTSFAWLRLPADIRPLEPFA